jgi:Fe-S cluster biogenesis protein NfuA
MSSHQEALNAFKNGDLQKALGIWESEENLSNPIGLYNLGLIYQNPKLQDNEKSLYYFKQAALLGHGNASFRYALTLLGDRSDKEKLKEAFTFMKQAKKSGHPMAHNMMGGDSFANESNTTNTDFRAKDYEAKLYVIEDVLNRFIRPILHKDGGGIELIEFIDKEVIELKLIYTGNCSGCTLASTGTYQMIVNTLFEVIDKNIEVYTL